MKKFKWLLGILLLALVPMLQSCDDDDDYYSIGDFSWDWATVRTTGGGGYFLEGDRWGIIDPVSSSIPWYRPVDGERVVAFFNPLADMKDEKGVQVKMEGIQDVLTKGVEEMKTTEEEEEFGNDPIVIYQGDTRVRDQKSFRKVPIALISLRVPAVLPAYCQRNNRL